MKVAAGVHQLKVPIPDNPLEYLNAYLIEGRDGYILVDSGWSDQNAFDALQKQLGEIGVALQDIALIAITHAHPDHLGLAGKLRESCQAPILMHEIDAALTKLSPLTEKARWAQWLQGNGMPITKMLQLRKHVQEESDFSWLVSPDKIVKGGEKLPISSGELEVMWTPGHSPGHICLYDPANKILFSGDHILPIITPNVSLSPYSSANPLGDYIDYLKKMGLLEIDLVLPAHEHIFQNLGERIQQILEHHEQRIADLLNCLGAKQKTAYQITMEMLWVGISAVTTGKDLPISMQPAAVGETLAHLELLRLQERVERVTRNGIAFFRARVA